MKVIKKDSTGAVLIDTGEGFNVWMDIYKDSGELVCEWNKYIFFENNSLDMQIRAFQDDINNFDICSSLAIEYYLNN